MRAEPYPNDAPEIVDSKLYLAWRARGLVMETPPCAPQLLAYGSVRFASKVGQLVGNHFLTIVAGTQYLPELGRLALRHGANRSSSRRSESKASGVVPLTGDRWNPNPLRGCRGRRRGRQVSQQVSQLTRRWREMDSNPRSRLFRGAGSRIRVFVFL